MTARSRTPLFSWRPGEVLGRRTAIGAVLGIPVVIVFAWALLTPLGAQSVETQLPAGEALRRAVNGELKAQANDHSHWMYQVKEKEAGKEKVKLVIETRDGDLERLQSVDGQPISAEQQTEEAARIDKLIHRREEQKKRKQAQQEDDERMERLFKMLPDAVTSTYGQHEGDLVEILFRPNPNFHPDTHEALVFHEMEGRMWIDTKQNRLAEIEGHLMKEVKFGGGLLGYLHKGGEFHVKQSEVGSGHWEVTLLHVNMRGRVLFFKTLSVQEDEVRSHFERVADNLTLAEAAQELQKRCGARAQTARREAWGFSPYRRMD